MVTTRIPISVPEQTLPNLCIINMVLALNVTNPLEMTIIKRRDLPNILNSERQDKHRVKLLSPTSYKPELLKPN